MQTSKKKSVNFGKVVAKVITSEKVEIHIKTGARVNGKPCVDVRQFVKTQRYTGYTKKGFMIPEESWSDFQKQVRSVKVK